MVGGQRTVLSTEGHMGRDGPSDMLVLGHNLWIGFTGIRSGMQSKNISDLLIKSASQPRR